MQLRDAITKVQNLGKEYNFTVVLVGGGLLRLIGSETKIKKIDKNKRQILLSKGEDPQTKRSEDQTTTVDIDCIAFSREKDPYTKKVKENFDKLKAALKTLGKNQPGFPTVSIEPVLYHPYFPKPNTFFQFVSSIESYHDGNFLFRLGSIGQEVKSVSLAPWTYIFSDQEIVSLNPLALQKRYEIRGFSIKPKDKEKVWGKNALFSKFVAEFNKQTNNTMQSELIEWENFAQLIQTTSSPLMISKRILWNLYWITIGTYLAHGTGFIGKLLLPLGNTFFAGK